MRTQSLCFLVSTLVIILRVGYSGKVFDYYIFAVTWPPTFCDAKKLPLPKVLNNFTIHGLWPKILLDKDPQCKPKEQFNITKLQDLLKDLERLWPSLKDYSKPESFWKHEFSKHGMCVHEDPKIKNQHGYFEFGLNLMKRFNILEFLKKHGIIPHVSQQYETRKLQDIFESEFRHNVSLYCTDKKGQKGVQRLEEIWMCLDPDHQPINCPPISKCSTNFTFPPFPHLPCNTLK
ncbi:unnamed protein product [Schistosoma haematobium]|nr:unnamed protein product [Schistosoma haematobium]